MTTPVVRVPPGCIRRAAFSRVVRGVTLMELMVVVALLAVLLGVAAPAMSAFAAARRVEDLARRLGEDLVLGRNEAVKRNATVLLCVDVDATGCNAAPGPGDWARGWRLCVDADGDDACDAATPQDPNPLRVEAAVAGALRVSGPASRIRFNPNGTMTSTAFTPFEVRSAQDGGPLWRVRFAASGATSVRKA